MAERTSAFQSDVNVDSSDSISGAAAQVKESVDHFVEEFDLHGIAKRVEDFGRENPVGLALSALTLGFAVGILMRSSRKIQSL